MVLLRKLCLHLKTGQNTADFVLVLIPGQKMAHANHGHSDTQQLAFGKPLRGNTSG
jgi:hypothetical protein